MKFVSVKIRQNDEYVELLINPTHVVAMSPADAPDESGAVLEGHANLFLLNELEMTIDLQGQTLDGFASTIAWAAQASAELPRGVQ